MFIGSDWRGHAIVRRGFRKVDRGDGTFTVEGGAWYFADNGEPVEGSNRPCGKCDKPNTPEGYDACFGKLNGVMNACCGHGDAELAYLQFAPNVSIRGQAALDLAEHLKTDRPKPHLCGNPDFGVYTGQVTLLTPDHMHRYRRDRDLPAFGICVDVCLALEITKLWKAGITTTGCCCGHGRVPPYIGVVEHDIPLMLEMGYVVQENPCRPGDRDTFYAKTQLDF